MGLGGVPIATFILVLATLAHQVLPTEDIYWEGDLDDNEFLEVKPDIGHFARIKRSLWDSWFSGPTTSTTESPPANYKNSDDDADDNAISEGSGYSDHVDNGYAKEKTLSVTFMVKELCLVNNSSRDTPEFQNFSRSLVDAVNALFENLPGTQKASLLRIHTSSSEDFYSCRVTMDIVTIGNDDTDQIAEILKEHIRTKHSLGNITVDDTGFTAKVIDPETIDMCDGDVIKCGDGSCVPASLRCDSIRHCPDGADEEGCSFDNNEDPNNTPGGDYNEINDNHGSVNTGNENNSGRRPGGYGGYVGPDYGNGNSGGGRPGDYGNNVGPDSGNGNNDGGRPGDYGSNGGSDYGNGNNGGGRPGDYGSNVGPDYENGNNGGGRPGDYGSNVGPDYGNGNNGGGRPGDYGSNVDPDYRNGNNGDGRPGDYGGNVGPDAGNDNYGSGRPEDFGNNFSPEAGSYDQNFIPDTDIDTGCTAEEFPCDVTRCIAMASVCNGVIDCDDRTDETQDYCRKDTGSEFCNVGDFRCGPNGRCIDPSKRCDRTVDCPNQEDEIDCECNENEYRCEFDRTCIDRSRLCDGVNNCGDAADENSCPATCPEDSISCPGAENICAKRCDSNTECPNGEDESDCDECYHECDGRCLSPEKICDNVQDCLNNSDEDKCDLCNGFEDFRCSDGECIKANLRCNNLTECRDHSDEKDCANTIFPEDLDQCRDTEFQCRNGICINNLYLCDGDVDCTDRSDEENCPGCTGDQFQCNSGLCIPREKLCDGRDDCRDNSDEDDCGLITTHRPDPFPVYTPPPRPPYPRPDVDTERPTFPDNNGGRIRLNLTTDPKEQTMHADGDVVFQCRDVSDVRAPVRWVRQDGRPLPPGSTDKQGRLEMFRVSVRDSGVYVCQAPSYLSYPEAQATVSLYVSPQRPQPPQLRACKSNEATCQNGQCIPKSAVCDGKPDCADQSDEDRCNIFGKCEPHSFRCDNKKCILKTWMCDSQDDCGDGSDERNCGTSAPGDPCSPVEFRCDSGQCIPKSFHCDDSFDCLDNSDETRCVPISISSPPKPAQVRLNPGDTLTLRCTAVGGPIPLISWRLNWGNVPDKCVSSSEFGEGILTCPDMQPGDSGAYSCEAINNKGTAFAYPDAIVEVTRIQDVCPPGFFNSEATTENECIRCFCFGESNQCQSADLFTFNMPMLLGEGGTKLLGVKLDYTGRAVIDSLSITNQYVYQPLRGGATITKLENVRPSVSHPYLAIPESYKGNQLKSYGGYIKYTLSPHLTYGYDNKSPDIIMKGTYETLLHYRHGGNTGHNINIEARLTPENWQKASPSGPVQASREDIMMTLDNIEHILLRAELNNAGVNITSFVMDSADHINYGLGLASLVEQCTCPPGYEGLSCQKCSIGYQRERNGRWLGHCVPERKPCPAGTYGDPGSGYACSPCPCPHTVRSNQFADTCSLGPDGVVCDCHPGYEGYACDRCAAGFEGNPLILGDYCRPIQISHCDPAGTIRVGPGDQCICKDNVQGQFCDQCTVGSYYLSDSHSQGCAKCFCTGETQECTSSSLRRRTTSVTFNVPQIVDQVRVYASTLTGLSGGRYSTPIETELTPTLYQGTVRIDTYNLRTSSIYYWSLPASFAGNKVTSYGGFLSYTLDHLPVTGSRNNAPDVQLISENRLTFHYFGNSVVQRNGILNASLLIEETGWKRLDGKDVSREDFLLALADVKTILVKASYTNQLQMASMVSASIETADARAAGRLATEVEQCVCPLGYMGTSCEDCTAGYTRGITGLYLKDCKPCECNGRSSSCHSETGICFDCKDNTSGDKCELCLDGYEKDPYGTCQPSGGDRPYCDCDERGMVRCSDGYCVCKENVEGDRCDQCKSGTFGLNSTNPEGCLACYCSGATTDCHEANYYSRIPIPAPVIGPDNGGFRLTSLYDDVPVNDQYVSASNESELTYVFSGTAGRYDTDLFWSIPNLPGDRVGSYGGYLTYTMTFQTGGYPETVKSDHDVILTGPYGSVFWNNPSQLTANEPTVVRVPIRESGWFIDGTGTPATRRDMMEVLRDVKRVLVKATLSHEISSTSIADVSMDYAERSVAGAPPASGVEICNCPEGNTGTSCEDCKNGYYHDAQGYCIKCNCNGYPCSLAPNNKVICHCGSDRTGRDCSIPDESTSPPNRRTVVISVVSPITRIAIAEVGSSVTFSCRAQSSITTRIVPITWSKSEGHLPQGRYQADTTTGVLILTQLRESDSGKYVCSADDGVSTTQQYVTLNVPGNNMTAPRVSLRKPVYEQYVGQRIELECIATGTPTPTISWRRASGEPLPDSYYVNEENNGVSVLIIEVPQEDDSGEYICAADNAAGSNYVTAMLTVKRRTNSPPAMLSVSPMNYTVREGADIRVVCRGSVEIPAGAMDWVRQDGVDFSSSVTASNGILYFVGARPQDQGVYTCQALTTNARPVSVTVYVISEPSPDQTPRVTIRNRSVTIPTGATGTVDCEPQGYPLPLIKWSKNDGTLSNDAYQRDNTLIITKAQESDAGYYLCAGVVNDDVVASEYINVEIERREAPTVMLYPDAVNAAWLDGRFQLQCVVHGDPEPVVTWQRTDSRPFTSNTHIIPGNVLSFEKVDVNDEGEYTCNAANIAGSANMTAILKVQSVPEITVTPSNEITVREGDPIKVECRANGFPRPTVSIQKSDGIQLIPPIQGTAALRIRSASYADDGEYSCVAKNDADMREERFIITVTRGDGGFDGGSGDYEYTEKPTTTKLAIAGQDAVLYCDVPADMTPVWRRLDREMLPSNVRQIGTQLVIQRASKNDEGQYECSAYSSTSGMSPFAAAIIQLSVMSAPRATVYPTSRIVRPGDSPTITCQVEGDDIREVYWQPVNRTMPRDAEIRDRTLTLHNIKVEDAGYYMCVADNDVGKATTMVEVIVNNGGQVEELVGIDDSSQTYDEGEDVRVNCRSTSSDVTASWSKPDTMEYVEFAEYGGGAMLTIKNVRVSDGGVYRCTGRSSTTGYSSFQDFYIEVRPQVEPPYPDSGSLSESAPAMYTARLRQNIELPCMHDIPGPVTFQWESETMPLRPEIRNYDQSLRLNQVTQADAGVYKCRVTGASGSAVSRAVLRVIGVVPRFEGGDWLTLPRLKDSYQQFNIEISFKPADEYGLILYNSQRQGRDGHYIAFQMVDGIPQFIMQNEKAVVVNGDRPLVLNQWHTAMINRVGSRVSMSIDNYGPFTNQSGDDWSVLELGQPLYVGGLHDFSQVPPLLAGTSGFVGCVGMLILGKEEQNIMINSTEAYNVKDCDSCNPNPCLNDGVCQDVPNERGYECICSGGYSGAKCDRFGEGCRTGLCGEGKCIDTADGYKCVCPINSSGKNCEHQRVIEYPAFSGSAYFAIMPPENKRFFLMSMRIKAAAPVADGIIMYCAESERGQGGFMSLAVKDAHLEFRYFLDDGQDPVILTSKRELVANDWTRVIISRTRSIVNLTTESGRTDSVNGYLSSDKTLLLKMPMFVGGVEESITLNDWTGVSGGFYGCIVEVKVSGNPVDLVNSSIISANVEECRIHDRGDIPEAESICRSCRNGGYCTSDSNICSCPPGFTGTYCEQPSADPCANNRCRNGATCRPRRGSSPDDTAGNMTPYTCDCPLGYAGPQCQNILDLYQTVGFSSNGYLELPSSLLVYNEPRNNAFIGLAFNTMKDGVLFYQRETGVTAGSGDFLILRVDHGFVTAELNLGDGSTQLTVDDTYVTDGARHMLLAELSDDATFSLKVDRSETRASSGGLSKTMNADSNLYIGGIPEAENMNGYPGWNGCIEHIEFMGSHVVNLGEVAVTARNAHRCSDDSR